MASSLNYKNIGQTPALSLKILIDAVIIPSTGSDIKPPRAYSASYNGDSEPTVALGGGIAASDPVTRTFKEAELEDSGRDQTLSRLGCDILFRCFWKKSLHPILQIF